MHSQAMSFCLECGYVMRGTDLRASLPTAQEDIGIFVSKGDDGSRAGACSLRFPCDCITYITATI